MLPVKPFRPHRLFFWLNGGGVLLLVLLVIILVSVGDFGAFIAVPYGTVLALTACVSNALLLLYACVLVGWQVLRRLFFQAAVRSWWQLAVGYLVASLLWGWLWRWLASIHLQKWWG